MILKFPKTHLIAVILVFSTISGAQEISGAPVGCQKKSSHLVRVQLKGRVLLNRKFLFEHDIENKPLIQQAVDLQLKHLMGYFKNTTVDGLNAALSAYRGPLVLGVPQSVKYGITLDVSNYLPSERNVSSSPYVQKALRRGLTHTDDEAELIPYSQEIIIADCADQKFLNGIKPSLPLDPFLSLWLENKENRKPRKFGKMQLEQVSNCSSNELVEFGNIDQSWFFWSPREPKRDADGKSWSCLLDGVKTYQPDLVTIEEIKPPSPLERTFFGDLKKFRSTAIFGLLSKSDFFAKSDIDKFRKFIVKNTSDCKSKRKIPSCLTAWNAILKPDNSKLLEPGAYHFFVYLKYLYNIIEIQKVSVAETSSSDEILITYSGHFLDSTMPIEGSIYYGPTTLDYGPPVSKTYALLLHRAWQTSDSISYVGHAGLGHNMKIDEHIKLWSYYHLPLVRRTKPLWAGIYNCEGFSYFGFDLDQIFQRGKVDLILTESSGTEAGAKFPLAQLSLQNQIFANQSVAVQKVMSQYVQSSEFLTDIRLRSVTTP